MRRERRLSTAIAVTVSIWAVALSSHLPDHLLWCFPRTERPPRPWRLRGRPSRE